MLPAIFGLSGEALTAEERAFFREAEPAGFALFARNCVSPNQLRALTDDLRSLSGRADVPILVDQEGGRVMRLRPPCWPEFPAPGRFGALYEVAPMSAIEAARLNAEAIALVLAEAGINVAAMPVLDLRLEGGAPVIGDRAFSAEPLAVAALGRAVLEGLRAGGAAGIVKHMPGHGQASADSHFELPVVDMPRDSLEADFAPFRSLAWSPIGMTAHVLYTALDPDHCATFSAQVIGEVIRGEIGFTGLLLSDDLGMRALAGGFRSRAERASVAGCELVLHCSGKLEEMEQVALGLGSVSPEALDRLERALPTAPESKGDYRKLAERRDALLAFA